MSIVTKLKDAKTLDNLASLLGYKAKGLSYILYRIPAAAKYKSFTIPKRSGGVRTIQAPEARLKQFVVLKQPLIITEGKTDPVYLRSAIERRTAFHPQMGKMEKGRFVFAVQFMSFTRKVHDVLQLGGGSSDLKFFILRYASILRNFKYAPLASPVIVLIDNDLGAKEIFGVMRENTAHKTISTETAAPFYRVYANLYLVKTPETGKTKKMTCIEDLFDPSVRATQVDGLLFDPDKKHNEPGKYGKAIFAERVIRPNKATIVFDGFDPLLQRICDVLDDYAANPIYF